jgi:hypothetical protein
MLARANLALALEFPGALGAPAALHEQPPPPTSNFVGPEDADGDDAVGDGGGAWMPSLGPASTDAPASTTLGPASPLTPASMRMPASSAGAGAPLSVPASGIVPASVPASTVTPASSLVQAPARHTPTLHAVPSSLGTDAQAPAAVHVPTWHSSTGRHTSGLAPTQTPA